MMTDTDTDTNTDTNTNTNTAAIGAADADANLAQITITVNGAPHTLAVRHHWSLLDALRDALRLTGAKRGCVSSR